MIGRPSETRRDLDAFSVRFPGRPVVIVGQDKGVAARSRFDAAHELAHLLLHLPEDAGQPYAEKQAHQFAAALLMPADVIRPELPATADWRRLIRLKVEWGVSLAALLMRAKTLEVMSDHRYVSAIKQMSARGWRRAEPGDDQLGRPERPRLIAAAVAHLRSADTTLERVVLENGSPIHRVMDLVRARPTTDPPSSSDLEVCKTIADLKSSVLVRRLLTYPNPD